MTRRLADAAEAAGRDPEGVSEARRLLGVDERVLRLAAGSPNSVYALEPLELRRARQDVARAIARLGL